MKTYKTIKVLNASDGKSYNSGRKVEVPAYIVYRSGYPLIAKDFMQGLDIAKRVSVYDPYPVTLLCMTSHQTFTYIKGRADYNVRSWVYCYKKTEDEPILIRVEEIKSSDALAPYEWARDYNDEAEEGCYAVCMREDVNGNVTEDEQLNKLLENYRKAMLETEE